MSPPQIEYIDYEDGKARAYARMAFWIVVNEGHGFTDWKRSCALYWHKVQGDDG